MGNLELEDPLRNWLVYFPWNNLEITLKVKDWKFYQLNELQNKI